MLVDARDNLVINNAEEGRLVAVVGLSDTVIVQTPQITLVCPMSDAERVKELVAQVTEQSTVLAAATPEARCLRRTGACRRVGAGRCMRRGA